MRTDVSRTLAPASGGGSSQGARLTPCRRLSASGAGSGPAIMGSALLLPVGPFRLRCLTSAPLPISLNANLIFSLTNSEGLGREF